MACRDFLFSDPLYQLALRMMPCRIRGQRSLLEYPAHVVEQPGGRQQYCRGLIFILVIQGELRVPISLCGRLCQPVGGLFLVMRNLIASEIQFAESVLGILISLFSSGGQVFDSL